MYGTLVVAGRARDGIAEPNNPSGRPRPARCGAPDGAPGESRCADGRVWQRRESARASERQGRTHRGHRVVLARHDRARSDPLARRGLARAARDRDRSGRNGVGRGRRSQERCRRLPRKAVQPRADRVRGQQGAHAGQKSRTAPAAAAVERTRRYPGGIRGDASGVRHPAARRPGHRHGADPRRKRDGKGAGRARDSRQQPAAATARSSRFDCAALPDTLLESELFGYERGAFTGAVSRKPGPRRAGRQRARCFWTRSATLSPPLQAKLLRLLQDRQFERLGGTRADQRRRPLRRGDPPRSGGA